ncbi:unnamed protein product [Enterobius vermicularis]|uniref:GOLD domain-containing protein n=1 Tax=Enterobius vermicularis TaxID=51028 RepID=A0A0N4UXY6_ENTVE|nr:unnamed protein product [Enterobius vermicularis]
MSQLDLLVLHRDDCESVKQRSEGVSSVFAKDKTGRIIFDEAPEGLFEVSDFGYFLIDTSSRPLRCLRSTVAPPELEPVAAYQLQTYRKKNQIV